jgi:heterodisulfide reductase subunit C
MIMEMTGIGKNALLSLKIYQNVNESVFKCYQCGKCSAGCPLSSDMDYPPSQLMRMLQLGFPQLEDKVLKSYTIWLCLTCETCIARCPQEVDIPKIMDFLRGESIRQKKSHPSARDIISFHKSFLDSIKYTGRLYEMGTIADYKMRTFHFLKDLLVAPKLLYRGKLPPFPHIIKDMSMISKIFKKSFGEKKGKESER